MGAHAHNLPLRALELGPPISVSVKSAEPVKAAYPSQNDFRWDFAARGKFAPVWVWWHDGPDAAPPKELTGDLVATYGKVPTNGCLFVVLVPVRDRWSCGSKRRPPACRAQCHFQSVLRSIQQA
jgi:hypothetical protein